MPKRLRENAPKINWTPEPIRPELLHFFDLPSISTISQNYTTSSREECQFVHSQAIPSSPKRMPIRTPQPPREKKNLHQMVLTYHRTRKAPALKHPGPSPSQMLPGRIDLKPPRGDRDCSVTEIGSPLSLSLSEKWARRKRAGTLLFSVKIPKHAKRRRMSHARSAQVGWVNTGGVIPWVMVGSQIPYNLRRRLHFSGGNVPMAVAGNFKSAPLSQPENGERKLSVSLLSNEIEEDFMKMTGEMPLHKLNKRPKKTQSQLDNLFPGMCFITSDNDILCNLA